MLNSYDHAMLEIFRVASEESGYGKMNTFAVFMLNELQQGRCMRLYAHGPMVRKSVYNSMYLHQTVSLTSQGCQLSPSH